ncbi:Glutathione S-transferase T3 [Cardamine amara subsp. amara]|uniref:Glutathione S-transferase T3 n=1 Tax=Cardamine amara subsp. amara TaxID=228776 RepID=A0ABD1B795_CARAN
MDSFNLYRQKSNFMDLLNSQEDDHYHETNPFESSSQSTTVGSSQIPLFSTECSDDPTVDQDNRQGRKRWKPSEDVVSISSWLNTSKDPIVSNEQKSCCILESNSCIVCC